MKKVLCAALLTALLFASGCARTAREEPVHLVWWMLTGSETPADWPETEAALNAYSAEKIGVTCEFKYYDANQIALVSQTGEYFDIAFTCDWWNDFATNVSMGMFRNSHSWLMWSKHPLMSPSRIQTGDLPLFRSVKHCSMASCVPLPTRNP